MLFSSRWRVYIIMKIIIFILQNYQSFILKTCLTSLHRCTWHSQTNRECCCKLHYMHTIVSPSNKSYVQLLWLHKLLGRLCCSSMYCLYCCKSIVVNRKPVLLLNSICWKGQTTLKELYFISFVGVVSFNFLH